MAREAREGNEGFFGVHHTKIRVHLPRIAGSAARIFFRLKLFPISIAGHVA
jgi:hypothetical protein